MSSFRVQDNTLSKEPVAVSSAEADTQPFRAETNLQTKNVISVVVKPAGAASEAQAVFDSIEKSREIVGAARKQADYILARAKSEAERLFQEERERGFAAGKNEALRQFWGSVQQQKDLLFKGRHAILELSSRMAKEVLGTELIEQPESILKRIARAIQHFAGAEAITIFVHPSKITLVEEALREVSLQKTVSLSADETLPDSDARLVSLSTEVSASVLEHLNAISSQLKKHFHE